MSQNFPAIRHLAVAALAALLGACAPGAGTVSPAPQPAGAPAPVVAAPGAASASAIARARADSLRYPYTAADIHFMSGMIGHHAQAIEMSRLAPSRHKDPAVQRLAERIIGAQDDEIATMQRWLAARRQPVPEAKAGPMRHVMNGVAHDMLMPGMLSEAQMRQLEAARGADFDRLFLQYMIQHHRGAIAMVQELFASPGAAQDETVFKFANDVNVDQVTEIARMEKMLAAIMFGVQVQ